MRENAWAVCHGDGEIACFWAEAGPNVWNAAVAHEEAFVGHNVEVSNWTQHSE